MKQVTISVKTAADGTATVIGAVTTGKVHSVYYVKDAENAFADGVDFAVTAQKTGETVWTESNVNASTVRYPRAPVHSPAGAPLLYAAGGAAVTDKVGLASDRLKIVIAQGGNAKEGKFIVLLD